MSYIEERINYLAIKCWQNDRNKHEMTCGNPDGCEFPLLRAEMRPAPGGHDLGGRVCVLICDECGYQQGFIPEPVIDNFLDRI